MRFDFMRISFRTHFGKQIDARVARVKYAISGISLSQNDCQEITQKILTEVVDGSDAALHPSFPVVVIIVEAETIKPLPSTMMDYYEQEMHKRAMMYNPMMDMGVKVNYPPVQKESPPESEPIKKEKKEDKSLTLLL